MKTAKTADDRALLLRMTEEAYRLPTWNGTNLRSALRRVSPEVAQWLPPGGGRSVADITVHCAYWKYAIRRQLRGDERGSFGIKGTNWFRPVRPLTASLWTSYLQLLDEQHVQLCDAIAYHTGQVQLIKKLWKRTHGGTAKTTRG
jgi:hypothetical protein